MAWRKIEFASEALGDRLALAKASVTLATSEGRRTAMAKRLTQALELLTLDDDDRNAFDEMRDALELAGRPEAVIDPSTEIARARTAVMSALVVAVRARPQPQRRRSEAAERTAFAREVRDALNDSGADVRLSDGRNLDLLRKGAGLSVADLQPIERLLWALGAYPAASPDAFARWVREALREKTGAQPD
jgi:hypothetical protein